MRTGWWNKAYGHPTTKPSEDLLCQFIIFQLILQQYFSLFKIIVIVIVILTILSLG
jgi:hypothetical protein